MFKEGILKLANIELLCMKTYERNLNNIDALAVMMVTD